MQALFPRTVPVGVQFGVVLVIENGQDYQVATFRSDGAYLDGRHPRSVTFSSAEEDARRRDFTVNGLFYDPIDEKVLDFVGGRQDLETRTLRAIGIAAERFAEDKLRLLRGVRFAAVARLQHRDGNLDGHPRRSAGHPRRQRRTHPRRVGKDLHLTATRARLRFARRQRADGRDPARDGSSQRLRTTAATFIPRATSSSTRASCFRSFPRAVSVPLVFAALFHDLGKPPTMQRDETGRIRFNGHESVGADMTEKIMRRLRFSNEEIEATVEMVQNHMVFKDVQNMRVARLKRFMARPTFDDELELHRVDCLASHGLLDNYRIPEAPPRRVRQRTAHSSAADHRTRSHRHGLEAGTEIQDRSRRRAGPATRRHPAHPRRSARVGEKEFAEARA